MPGLHDVAKMTVTGTPGTGTITLNAASTGYQTFAASGVVDQEVLSYRIDDGSNWEVGTGTYTVSGTTLSRGVVFSSNANALISATSAALISIVALAPDYSKVLLSEIVTAASQSNVTFSNIPQVYRDLEIRVRGRSTTAATSDSVIVQFNGDTGSNYSWTVTDIADNAVAGAVKTYATTSIRTSDITAANSPANFSQGIVATVFDYRGTTFAKNVVTQGGVFQTNTTGGGFTESANAQWNSTAAITSLKVFLVSGNFVNGTVVSIYGHY